MPQHLLYLCPLPWGAEVEELIEWFAEHLDQQVGIVLVVNAFEGGRYLVPSMVGVEQRDEVGEVEVAKHHVVNAFGFNA